MRESIEQGIFLLFLDIKWSKDPHILLLQEFKYFLTQIQNSFPLSLNQIEMFTFLLGVTLIVSSVSLKGIDFSSRASYLNLKCVYDSGYKFAIIRGSRSGTVDTNMRFNVANANRAGIKTDLYICPCIGNNATNQIINMINSLAQLSFLIQTVWIDVETSYVSQACSWKSYQRETDCEFIGEMVAAIKSKGKKVGIYSSAQQWKDVFEDSQQCMKFADLPLWYSHQNSQQNFDSFRQFAGWKVPLMKHYAGDRQLCNITVNLNWKP